MPPVSEAQRKAMFAAKAGKSTLGIPQKVGAEFAAADEGGKLPARAPKKYAKGGYVFDNPDRAYGGPPRTERSRFMKTPDVFRTSIEQQDYGKKNGEDMPEKDKSLPAIKPRMQAGGPVPTVAAPISTGIGVGPTAPGAPPPPPPRPMPMARAPARPMGRPMGPPRRR